MFYLDKNSERIGIYINNEVQISISYLSNTN